MFSSKARDLFRCIAKVHVGVDSWALEDKIFDKLDCQQDEVDPVIMKD